MNLSYLPPFGHACCPHCKSEFDLVGAVPTFLEKAPHNDIAIYMMCSECHDTYQAADKATAISMANKCFINFKLTGIDSEGAVYPWAITTMLTMELNEFDPVAAIENGHGLTRDQYFGICDGTYEVCVLLAGLRIMTDRPTTPEAL
jgi:hypothetical protein